MIKRKFTSDERGVSLEDKSLLLNDTMNSIIEEKKLEGFLPAKKKGDNRLTLVLDLDETLVHYTEEFENGVILLRPYCISFL